MVKVKLYCTLTVASSTTDVSSHNSVAVTLKKGIEGLHKVLVPCQM